MRARRDASGFTLLEVLVALVIVAFGMGALMATLTSAADSVIHLREKSFAEWIALNRISEARLARALSPGKSNGTVEYAGANWRWEQVVARMSLGGGLQIDVSVARAPGADGKAQPSLATAKGFRSGSLVRGDGLTPDWSGDTLKALQPRRQVQQPDPTPGQPSPPGGGAPGPAPSP